MSNRGLAQKKTFLVIILSLLIGIEAIFAEGSRYLIITHDDFYNAIQPLAEWKNKKGLMTKVTKLSEISPYPTPVQIRDYIRDAYLNWNPKPEYILLVGQVISGQPGFLPIGQTSPYRSDNFYADIVNTSGDTISDTLADVLVGRFPCTTTNQCNIMVAKILNFERTPLLVDTLWFRRATTIQQDTSASPGDTIHYQKRGVMFACSLMVNFGNFTLIDTLTKANPTHNYSNVIDALNLGRIFLFYTGEGLQTNWGDPFNVLPESESLRNGFKLPVIFSWSCWTVQQSSANSFGERWLRVDNKGAVGYIGTSAVGFAECRSPVARNFYRAIFTHNIFNLGKALNEGKDSLWYINYPNTDPRMRHWYYTEWNLLGDPELNLWTAVPQPLLVTHNSVIPTGPQTFIVAVKDINGVAVSNALVCVTMSNDTSVYEYGYTNGFSALYLDISPKDSGWLRVTVTARNHIPYEDSCLVEPIGPDATGPNQGRHLARAPNSPELEYAFNANNSIFWQWMIGQAPRLLTYVGNGKYPSIAKNEEGSAWISCAAGDSLNCYIRGTWKKVNVVQADSIGPPSLVLSVYPATDILGALGYVVYTAKLDESGQRYICFSAFDSTGSYYMTTLDYGDVSSPSISITPKDLLHIVWQRTDGEQSRIYYITTLDGITQDYIRNQGQPNWSDIYPISRPVEPVTEPASNPFTETYGEYVYAAWHGPNEEGQFPGDVWRRRRKLTKPPWEWDLPENKSETRDNESNYPVMSTDFVTVWQEQIDDTNWNI